MCVCFPSSLWLTLTTPLSLPVSLPPTEPAVIDGSEVTSLPPSACFLSEAEGAITQLLLPTRTSWVVGKIEQNICYGKWHFTEIILLDLLMSSDLCLIQLVKRSQGISGGGFVTHLTDKSFLFDFVWFLPTAIYSILMSLAEGSSRHSLFADLQLHSLATLLGTSVQLFVNTSTCVASHMAAFQCI